MLESAQAAGQKAQLDAQIGQGSIFDLGGFGGEDDGAARRSPARRIRRSRSRSSTGRELLAIEKESIGLFITEHPLKRVREALRVKGDTVCTEVPERRDGEWVKVGGMISACKKIKTRSGSTVMFATLDDLDAQVELLVFEKVILASEAALQPDQIVLVRGTVDHGENGKVCVKVADVTPFDPSEAEIERATDQAAALAAARAPRPLLPARRRRPPARDGDRRAQADLRGLPGRVRGRARGPHPHRPAPPALRRRVPGRRPQRRAQGRAATACSATAVLPAVPQPA